MSARVMIVEDEMLVAYHIEAIVEELGFEPVGIAADTEQAFTIAERAPDIALIDLNLRDGLTGPKIGSILGEKGVSVVFVTANPSEVQPPIAGALGVVSKPCGDQCLKAVLHFAHSTRSGKVAAAPDEMRLF